MAGKFKINDICIVVYAGNYPELLGAEVTLLSGLEEVEANDGSIKIAYKTDLVHNGLKMYAQEYALKLKEPPKEFSGELRIIEMFNVAPNEFVKQFEEECHE